MSGTARDSRSFMSRAERLLPRPDASVEVEIAAAGGTPVRGRLKDISPTGMQALVFDAGPLPADQAVRICLGIGGQTRGTVAATVQRTEHVFIEQGPTGLYLVALAFDEPQGALLECLKEWLVPSPYVTDELREDNLQWLTSSLSAEQHTILDFYRQDAPDLFAKCGRFYELVKDLQRRRLFQALYRVTLTSGLDHRILVFNPIRRREEEMICFDSNSYLGLHLHPRVVGAVKKALDHVGYGTPSAQLLCGTNRYLRELEETISRFHGREDTLVFPSGYAANVGILTALAREKDLVVRDRFSHASIHDGCRATGSRFIRAYPHADLEALEQILTAAAADGCMGKLIVTDGVFSMHGRLAPLAGLAAVARRHNARLMVDEAHSTGVIGPSGRGLEDHFGLPGCIDVLMGTFSKAPGTAGGYVCGSRALIYYLRFYANSSMFTASLPAATCAGVSAAFQVMEDEPEHRQSLWRNVQVLVPALKEAGFLVPEAESPIVTVFVGSNKLLWLFSRDLFDKGIKCGNVAFPAVPMGEAIVRLTVNARHTAEDLERAVEVFSGLGDKYGIRHRSAEEIRAIGDRLSLDAPAQ